MKNLNNHPNEIFVIEWLLDGSFYPSPEEKLNWIKAQVEEKIKNGENCRPPTLSIDKEKHDYAIKFEDDEKKLRLIVCFLAESPARLAFIIATNGHLDENIAYKNLIIHRTDKENSILKTKRVKPLFGFYPFIRRIETDTKVNHLETLYERIEASMQPLVQKSSELEVQGELEDLLPSAKIISDILHFSVAPELK